MCTPRLVVFAAMLLMSTAALGQENIGEFHSKHFLYGHPTGTPSTNDLIIRDSYALSNNDTTKFADWVAYRLTPQEVSGTVDLQRTWRRDPWLTDEETLEPGGPDDYDGVGALGYQRGHQAPLASFKGVHAARELNYLSNITPQRGALNGGPWKDLEDAVREYVRRWETVWVITGPLYESPMQPLNTTEPHTVPSAYWKIVADLRGSPIPTVAAFIMQQNVISGADISDFVRTVDEIETRSGLSFFTELPAADQQVIKATDDATWFLTQN